MDHSLDNTQNQINNLIELNDELENYFRNTIIPQLFVDANLMLRKFTPPAMKQFSLSSADLGKHIHDVANNIRYSAIEENILQVIESGQDLEMEIQTTDKRWYQMNILPYVVQKENKTNGVIITFVDITDRIELLRGHEKLKLCYENMLFSVAHDLAGPITNMKMLVDSLKQVPSTDHEDYKAYTRLLEVSVDKLRATIKETAEVTRSIESDDEAEQVSRFENVIADASFALRDKIHETGAEIITDFHVPEANISRGYIRSVVYNLLSNAVKYKAPDRPPLIRIKTEQVDECVLLSVEDNGIGIPKDQQQKIFSRYTRLKTDVEGTGIGLFIVKRMIQGSGGRIEVESTPGVGTTFKVYLKS